MLLVTICHVYTSIDRLAAEQRISDLQKLVDETFQQFALDDSEDDFEDGDSPLAGDSTLSAYDRGSYPLLNLSGIDYGGPPLLKAYSSSPALTKSTGGMG